MHAMHNMKYEVKMVQCYVVNIYLTLQVAVWLSGRDQRSCCTPGRLNT